jgi:hypothetical protein
MDDIIIEQAPRQTRLDSLHKMSLDNFTAPDESTLDQSHMETTDGKNAPGEVTGNPPYRSNLQLLAILMILYVGLHKSETNIYVVFLNLG